VKISHTQHAFTSGKITPNLLARKDVELFASAIQEADNVLPLKQGPLKGNTGTEFIEEVKYSNKVTRLFPFVFSVEESLLLEVGEYYIRFYLNGGQIQTSYTAWAEGGVCTNGALFTYDGGYYRCTGNHTATDDFTDFDDLFEATTAADTVYEIRTSYKEEDIDALSISGIADLIYITHKDYPVHILSRYANDDWRYEELIFERGPYEALNTEDKRVWVEAKVTAQGGDHILHSTWTADGGGSGYIFSETDVGKLFSIRVLPTNLNDGTVAHFRIYRFISKDKVSAWKLSGGDTTLCDSAGEATRYWQFGSFTNQAWGMASGETAVWSSLLSNKYYYKIYVTDVPSPATAANGAYYRTHLSDDSDWWFDGTVVYLIEGGTLAADGLSVQDGYYFIWSPNRWNFYKAVSGVDTLMYTHSAEEDESTWPVYMMTDWTPQSGYSGSPTVEQPPAKEYRTNPELTTRYGPNPELVSIHQERLIFARTINNPQKVWFSVVADHEDFAPANDKAEVLDDSSFSYTLGATQINSIEWLLSGRTLVIGTLGGEFTLFTSSQSAPVTPTDVAFIRQGGRGSAPQQIPQVIGNYVVFIQRLGKKIRSMIYDVATDQYKSDDLTRFSDEAAGNSSFVDTSYVSEPSDLLYLFRKDGEAKLLTYSPEEQVTAWSDISLGGIVKSLASLPSENETYYETYFLVERTINSNTVQYIERLINERPTDKNYWRFLNCSGSYHSVDTATDTVAGLGFLEGEEVQVVADGETIYTKTVASGQITLEGSHNHIVVGLPYTKTIRLLPLDIRGEGGDTESKQKRTVRIGLYLTDTYGAVQVGTSLSTLQDLVDEAGEPMSGSEENSGMFYADIEEDFTDKAGQLYIVHNTPLPFTLLSATREVEFRD
jgi:hypothetical protein